MIPTPRTTVVLALVAAASLVVPAAAWVVALAALAGAFVVDALAIRGPVPLHRSVPGIVGIGIETEVACALPDLPGTTLVRQPSTADVRLTATDDHGAARLVALRRGLHVLPPPAVRRVGPLALAARHVQAVGPPAEVRAYPDLRVGRRLADAARRGTLTAAGAHVRGSLGLGTEFESIRDYVPDDDVRQINWRATARTGRQMSNQFRVEQDRELLLLIDAGRLMRAPIGDRTRLDLALDAASAVALVADALGDRCGAVAFDRELRGRVRPRRGGGAGVIRALYDLEPRPVDSDYDLAFRAAATTKRAFVLLFTDVVDEAAARSLSAAMPVISRRHTVTVVSADDPDLRAATTTAPERVSDVYAAAVALDLYAARDRATAGLRRTSAHVLQPPAGRLAAASVEAYLTAKSRALL